MKLAVLIAFYLCPQTALSQGAGVLRGQVTDSSGALIPGASVTVTNGRAISRTAAAGAAGSFEFRDLPAGTYRVGADWTGFAPYDQAVEIVPGRTTALAIILAPAAEKNQVTVAGDSGPQVSTDAAANAGALVLRGEELDALPDDPDELAAELQALAGPAAGPSGGQIFIDGFTGGLLPPKSSIREIRINQNPFSSEFDRPGYGRIDVLTRPGSDQLHGGGYFNLGDAVFNARNPYAPQRGAFQDRLYGGTFSGALNHRASFFADFERREVDDEAVIDATVLDGSLNPAAFSQTLPTPNRRWSASPRLDYQLSRRHTLTARYRFTQVGQNEAGAGGLSLASRAYNQSLREHVVQVTETAVLGARGVSDSGFQFARRVHAQSSASDAPAILVLGAFSGGGAQVGNSWNRQDRWEGWNAVAVAAGTHAFRFGGRVHGVDESDWSSQNFGGTYTFSGGTLAPPMDANGNVLAGAAPVAVDSLESYRRTLLLSAMGMAPAQIRQLGGGASQFAMAAGDPLADVTQMDFGVFAQDDWRVRPNLTLSYGLRYEGQTNIRDRGDVTPRAAFAWAPGKRSKTVLRGGGGIFYDRVGESLTLQAARFNGSLQQQYILTDPDFFRTPPPVESLSGGEAPQATRRLAASLRAPYNLQGALSLERQLPFRTTVATTLTASHGEHLLLSRDVNAPLAGGQRPYGAAGEIYEYESAGILRQAQWVSNVSSHPGARVGLFAMYGYNVAHSDTDGANWFPANQYDLRADYGRSLPGMRHRFEAGGSVTVLHGFRVSPLLVGRSGLPFNITSGEDPDGTGLFTARPALAANASKPGVAATPYGLLDPNPAPGAPLVARNTGLSAPYFAVNLRVSRSFSFGGGRSKSTGSTAQAADMAAGYQSVFGDATAERHYALTIAASARNLLNSLNPDIPVGVVTSPLFLKANALATNYGPASAAANRRIELEARFSF